MHVAAALNTPLVAIFGSTNSTTTSPIQRHQPDRPGAHRMQPLHEAGLPAGPHELHAKRVTVEMVVRVPLRTCCEYSDRQAQRHRRRDSHPARIERGNHILPSKPDYSEKHSKMAPTQKH
jgi:hypothetical protein